jgi:hypothetical protein
MTNLRVICNQNRVYVKGDHIIIAHSGFSNIWDHKPIIIDRMRYNKILIQNTSPTRWLLVKSTFFFGVKSYRFENYSKLDLLAKSDCHTYAAITIIRILDRILCG